MAESAVRDSDFHIRVRIPGWLLLGALLLAASFWGGRYVLGIIDNSNGGASGFIMPMRVTALEASTDGGVLRATVLLENDTDFDPRALNMAVALDDGSSLAVPPLIVKGGAWHGRSYVVRLEKAIPDGRTVDSLRVTTHTGHWAVALPGVHAQ
jgi:hypothetical protein